MKTTDVIAKAVFLRARAGKEGEVASRLEALAASSRSDPGVIIYDVHCSATDPTSWFLYERYESQEHFNRHRENPALRRFLAEAVELLDGELDVRTFNLIGDDYRGRKPPVPAEQEENRDESEVR